MCLGNDGQTLGDEATFAGAAKRRPAAERSIGDERTHGDKLSGQDTVINDIEVVDLEARYKIEGALGQGGMGAVLLATDTRLGRKVAIKRILGEAAGNSMAVNRFLTEAKSIAALNHPNIVQIYDYGRAKDGPFLSMEYVDGGSLLDRCSKSGLPLEEAIDLACQLCDGLAKAHELGIIHRDIKPSNILLTSDGIPKLADFGLAKASAGDRQMTVTGKPMGTPDFMPPEQQRDARSADHRSDLWSLMATFYQLVTGLSPKVIRLQKLPQELQLIAAKALEDDREARYQSARELQDALRGVRGGVVKPRMSSHVEGVLQEGACAACGTVHADHARKFCRSCGESLRIGCLKCQITIPLWDTICGECGANQSLLLEARSCALAGEKTAAESKLAAFDFQGARQIAERQQSEPDPRQRQYRDWAVAFLRTIEESQRIQIDALTEAHVAAARCEAAWDYPGAISHLEAIPPPLQGMVLAGFDMAAELIDRLKRTHGENQALESRIAHGLHGARGELLADIKTLAARLPNREDLSARATELGEQLRRERDEAVTQASAMFDRHEYEGAERALACVDEAVADEGVLLLRNAARKALAQVAALIGTIWPHGCSDEQVDLRNPRLEARIEDLLHLVPAHEAARRLRDRLAAHRTDVERDNRAAIEVAQACLSRSDYESAAAAAGAMDRRDLSEELRNLIAVAQQKAHQVQTLQKKINERMSAQSTDGLLPEVERLLVLQPDRRDLRRLHEQLVSREQKREVYRQEMLRQREAARHEREIKTAAEINGRVEQSRSCERAGQFGQAAKLLATIPAGSRSAEIRESLARCGQLDSLQEKLRNALKRASDDWDESTLGAAQTICADYESLLADCVACGNEVCDNKVLDAREQLLTIEGRLKRQKRVDRSLGGLYVVTIAGALCIGPFIPGIGILFGFVWIAVAFIIFFVVCVFVTQWLCG